MKTVRRAAHSFGPAALVLLGVLFVQALIASPAAAWWNGDWTDRMKINADTGPKGAAITEPIGRTQVLVRLHSGNFNFATAKDDGSDLRFVDADDRTPLHFHIEKFDGLVDQVGLIWVDLPGMAPGVTTPFYMYWGNKNATIGGDPHATYDADQLLVYHFTEETGLPKDATGYGNNALTAGKRDEGGMVGFGIKLDGTAPIRVAVSPSLVIPAGQPMTWSMWVNPGKDAQTATLYQHRDGANALTIGIDQGVPFAQIEAGGTVQRATGGAAMTPDAWHLIAVTSTDKLTVYLDGEMRGEVAATLPALAGNAAIGGAAPVRRRRARRRPMPLPRRRPAPRRRPFPPLRRRGRRPRPRRRPPRPGLRQPRQPPSRPRPPPTS